MSDTTKYILSGVFIVISLAMLAYGRWYSRAENTTVTTVEAPTETGVINMPLSLHGTDVFIDNTAEDKIQPLILLEPTACVPCLNNLSDYRDLLKERSEFNDAWLLFMNHEKKTIERFLVTTGLDFSYAIVDSLSIPQLLRAGTVQNLLFWDPANERAFYNEPIPNVTTTLESKRILLNQVDSLWTAQNSESGL